MEFVGKYFAAFWMHWIMFFQSYWQTYFVRFVLGCSKIFAIRNKNQSHIGEHWELAEDFLAMVREIPEGSKGTVASAAGSKPVAPEISR